MSQFSQQRLESRIQQAISMMIVRGEIKHPDLSTLASVTHVDLSSDNAYATVYVSAPFEKERIEKSVHALQSAHGFVQKKLGAFLRTKNTPVLTFKLDDGFQEGEKVDRLLDAISRDGK